MTLQDANNYFENLLSATNSKSEIKIYERFQTIITKLKDRDFSEVETQMIETELDRLQLSSNSTLSKRHLKKAYTEFEKFIKNTFSLTSKGYYTNFSVSMGMLFGVVIGVLLGQRFNKSMGIALGICMGMFIGAFIGRRKDAQAEAAGNML